MEQQNQNDLKYNQLELSSYQSFQQVQNDFYISQIDSNANLEQNQTNQSLENCFQELVQSICINFFQEFLYSPVGIFCAVGICCTYYKSTISFIISLFFGFIFYFFSRNPEKYNSCSNETFRRWSLALSIILFSKCLAKITKALEQKFLGTKYISSILDLLSEIGCCICLIGLTFSISSDCGSLYVLALIFCGSLYTFFFFVIVYLIVIKKNERTQDV